MDKLIDLLYASAHDDALWPEALDELHHVLERHAICMSLEEPLSGQVSGPQRCLDLQRLALQTSYPLNRVPLARTTMPGDWTLMLSASGLPVEPVKEFGEHLRRSIQLHLTLNRPPDLHEQLEIWAESDVCVLFVRKGVIEFGNAKAAELLASRRVVARQGASLCFINPVLDEAFRTFESGSVGRQARARLKLLTGDEGGKRVLVEFSVAHDTHPSADHSRPGDGKGVLIVITFVDEGGAGRARAIEALGLLTPTEREILVALAGGHTVESLSRSQDRSIQTLRWHIKNIIAKTGSSSLTDAIRMASLLVPL